jgi:hypothetical protein
MKRKPNNYERKLASTGQVQQGGRSFNISFAGVRHMTPEFDRRLETAARTPSDKRRQYPVLALG